MTTPTLTTDEATLAGSAFLASLATMSDYQLDLEEEKRRDLAAMGLSRIGMARLRALQVEKARRTS